MHGLSLASRDPARGRSSRTHRTCRSRPSAKPHVALLPWGHTFEDFLEGVGVSFDQFCAEMSGGWLFGYVQALQLAGFQVSIFFCSSRRSNVVSMRHQPTGAEICLIPASRSYRWMCQFFSDPYAWETDEMFSGKRLAKPREAASAIFCLTLQHQSELSEEKIVRREVDLIVCQEYEYARFDIVTALGRVLHLPVLEPFKAGVGR